MVSLVSSSYAQANNVNITTPAAGDLILVFAHRDGSNTPPALAAGYLPVNQPNTGSNTNSIRVGYKFAVGTETNSGTWTNATSIGVIILRNAAVQVPLGTTNPNGGTGTVLTYNALTFQVTDGTSWFVLCGAHRTATNVNSATPPAGSTLVGSGVSDLAIFSSNGGVTGFVGGTETVNASSGWRTYAVEVVNKKTAVARPAQIENTLLTQTNSNVEPTGGNGFVLPIPEIAGQNNALIVCLTNEFSPTRTISIQAKDSSGANVGTPSLFTLRQGPVTDAGSTIATSVYSAEGIPANIAKLVVTYDNPVYGFQANLVQAAGIATSGAYDTGAASGVEATPVISSGSLTTTSANELVIAFAVSNAWGASMFGAVVNGWRSMPGFCLLAADRVIGVAIMAGIKASAGAVNPSFYLSDGATTPDNFAVLAVALKTSAGAGTPGTGPRVVGITHTQVPQQTSSVLSAPINGNLQVMLGAHGGGLVSVTSVVGTNGDTYALNAPAGNNPQIAYDANASADETNAVTVTTSTAAGWPILIYDLAGMNASPFDLRATASDGATGAGNIVNAPNITPSTAGGVVIGAIRLTGPPDSMSSPTDVIFDSIYYTNETDGSTMDIGEGYGHVSNVPASAQNWTWHNTVATPDWDASAFAFKAAETTIPDPFFFVAPSLM